MELTVDDYADSIMALMPGGKAITTEEGSTLKAIALAMAEGFYRLNQAGLELLNDLDPGGFSLDAAEDWFNMVGDDARTVGLINIERYRESVLFKLTVGGTFTPDLIYPRLVQRDVNTWYQSIPSHQELRAPDPMFDRDLFEDILPAHISVIYDESLV